MSVRKTVVVSGRVQGVNFRRHTQLTAQRFGVRGWVRNLANGDVEGCFEGDEKRVEELVEWCRQGPPAARVDGLQVSDGSYTGEFTDFQIRY